MFGAISSGNTLSKEWKIGAKIHFEEESTTDYLGMIEMNALTRDKIKQFFDIEIDSCACNAKVLLKKEGGKIILTHRVERSKPLVGEQLHATLLYTTKRIERGHETLLDIYDYLKEVDERLPQDKPPTLIEVASAYQKFITPDFMFKITEIELISNQSGSFILAKLQINGVDEIQNAKGNPISPDFLHITLAMIESSITEIEKIEEVISELKIELVGKMVKVGNRNGVSDLEFGMSGLADRIRPPLNHEDSIMKSNREKFYALKKLDLPLGQYMISGSGPLGIRNIKEIGDIDIIVTRELWEILSTKYEVSEENGIKKIVFPGGTIEAFSEDTWISELKDPKSPNISESIKNAEIIDGLAFDRLENVLFYKRKTAREKDLKDIDLIEKWMDMQKS